MDDAVGEGFMKYSFLISICMVMLLACHSPEGGNVAHQESKQDSLLYLNHADTARYVGIQTCALCHQDI